MLMRRGDQRGDTIVEVLIAIAVVSMVLVAAYQTTVRNIDGMETTQEHSEALQLAQTQLEYLHNASSQPSASGGECYSTNGTLTNGNNCYVNASGAVTNTQPEFKLTFSGSSPTYEITVTWPSIVSGETNSVSLFYQP